MSIVTCDIAISLDGTPPGRINPSIIPSATAWTPETTLHRGCSTTPTSTAPSWTGSSPPARSSWAATCSVRPRSVGPRLGGLVGPGTAVPRTGVRAHPRRAGTDRDGRRHDLPLRHGGPEEALNLAREAAGDRNVAIAGGASTINQYLAAGAIDELRLHVAPVVIDADYVRLFDGVGRITWSSTSGRWTAEVTHLVYRR